MKNIFTLLLTLFALTSTSYASSFKILTIKNGQGAFAKQFFSGFSSSVPEKIIAFDYTGDNGRVLSREIKRISPDLVLTIGELPIYSAISDFPSIPFLVSNFQSTSLENRNNVILVDHSISIKQKISMLKFLFPEMKTIGTIYDPVYSKGEFEKFAIAATSLGLKVKSIQAASEKEVERFRSALKGQIDGYYYISDNTTGTANAQSFIYSFLTESGIPSLSSQIDHADKGALLTIAPNLDLLGEKASKFAHKILEAGKYSKKSIHLSQEEYVLSVSMGACDRFKLNSETIVSFAKQAVGKQWTVLWKP